MVRGSIPPVVARRLDLSSQDTRGLTVIARQPASGYNTRMYGKVFKQMFSGSMVGLGPVPFALWCYCIAHAEPPGLVEINPVLAAAAIGCTVEEIEEAIAKLGEPDPKSRTKAHDGRRLIHVDGYLYEMPSWEKWHAIRRQEDRRAQNREAQRRRRERLGQRASASHQQPSAESAHTDTDTDTDTEDGWMDGSPGRTRNGAPTGTGTLTGGHVRALVGRLAAQMGAERTIVGDACPNSTLLPNAPHSRAQAAHACPYQVSVGNEQHRCHCCPECEASCREDVR